MTGRATTTVTAATAATTAVGRHRHRILIIANPAAGRSWLRKWRLDRIVAALRRRHSCTVVLRRSGASPGDVERLARDAATAEDGAEFDVVVAAGGDGTVNAVANGLRGSQRPIAILPFGTANVLAHEIGLPRRADALADMIATGPVQAIHPGCVDGRLFLTMASGGFDAEIVATVDPRLKRYLGRLAFGWAILVRLVAYRDCALTVTVDGVAHRAATIVASRGKLYAGPYVIAPEADLAEPILHLVLFRRSGRLAVLRYLAALLRGRLTRRDDIAVRRACRVTVSAAVGNTVRVQADGEPMGRLPAIFTVAEQPIFLIRPPPVEDANV